jgi:hypothetical protein
MIAEVKSEESPDALHHKDIISTRERLLQTALRYIKEGKDGTRSARIRTASSLAGIPITTIEIELEKIR